MPEKTKRAPSAPVLNQSFPSPKVQSVRGALFRNIRHKLLGSPRERLPPSATRRTRPYAVVPRREGMALSRVHSSAKAADPAKLLLSNKRRAKLTKCRAWYFYRRLPINPVLRDIARSPPNRNHNPTLTLTLMLRDPDCQHITVSSEVLVSHCL